MTSLIFKKHKRKMHTSTVNSQWHICIFKMYIIVSFIRYIVLRCFREINIGIEHHKPCMMLPDFKLIGKRTILQMSLFNETFSCIVYLERRVCGKAKDVRCAQDFKLSKLYMTFRQMTLNKTTLKTMYIRKTYKVNDPIFGHKMLPRYDQ